MLFWVIAVSMTALVVALLVAPLLRDQRVGTDPRVADVQVYRDQLAEVDADLARNILSPSEAEAVRTEISRRLLAAGDIDTRPTAPPSKIQQYAVAASTALVVGIAGLGFYAATGVPGFPDQPLAARVQDNAAAFAARPSQAEAEAMLADAGRAPPIRDLDPRHSELLDQLRAILAQRPEDIEGRRLLVTNLIRSSRWREAGQVQARIVEILGDAAVASDFTDLAEFQILATNGYISPESEAALRAALLRDPEDQRTRYYSGLTALEAGRADLTYDIWTRLLNEGPEDAPWIAAIRSQIREVARAAGREVPIGPDAAEIAAANEMSPEERDAMIRGMVGGLAERLATEGGPAEDWARLIRALGVLQEYPQAQAIWREASEVFADAPDDLALIRQAAQEAELVQ